jgi:hypothetical protein
MAAVADRVVHPGARDLMLTGQDQERGMGVVSRVSLVGVVVVALGLGLVGCGRLGDVMSGGWTPEDCHPDPKTVAAVRLEPMFAQAPPGAVLGQVTETVSCGWADEAPVNLGQLEREVTGAGAADDVARFYADLARSTGWSGGGHGEANVYAAGKQDSTSCSWAFRVFGTAVGIYQVEITYTPRDVRPSCL